MTCVAWTLAYHQHPLVFTVCNYTQTTAAIAGEAPRLTNICRFETSLLLFCRRKHDIRAFEPRSKHSEHILR